MKVYLCGLVIAVSLTLGVSSFAIGSKTYYPSNAIDTQTDYGACTVKCQQSARQVMSTGASKAKSRSIDRSQAKTNWETTGSASDHAVGKDEAACMRECTQEANQKAAAAASKVSAAASTAALAKQYKDNHQQSQANESISTSSTVTTTSDEGSSTSSS